MAKLHASFAEMIDQRPVVSLHLHTPAHQGRSVEKRLLPATLVARDVKYFTRRDLKTFEARIAALYGTKQTICLTTGTTSGCLASVLALARRHKRVYIVRNCHKSMVNGLILSGLGVDFIRPAGAVVTPEELAARLAAAGPDRPTAIIFTNPTFEGWSVDLPACVEVCRRHDLEIVVDESHGTHWVASPVLPVSALNFDVDIVLHSLHKYAGALVQTALVHLPVASRLTAREMSQGLDLIETTTVSNLLMLSVEKAIDRLFAPDTAVQIARLVDELSGVKRRQHNGDGLIRYHVPEGVPVQDPLKFFLTTEYAAPDQLARWFYEAGVDHEFHDANGVLFIFSFLNTLADLKRFERACRQVKPQLTASPGFLPRTSHGMNAPVMAMTPREAHLAPRERVEVAAAQGRTAAELIASCPPGWPLLIPGETIGEWHRIVLGGDYLIDIVKL
jgi:arginine/lysine/ornithine decarboxylase